MKMKSLLCLTFATSFMAASTAHMANASNDGASFRVHVSGHVKTQCELNSAGTFEQFSNDVYRLGTVGRFCNTAYPKCGPSRHICSLSC